MCVCVCVCAFDAAYPSCVRMDFALGRDGLRQPCRLDDTASWSTSRHSCRHLSLHCLCAASMLRASQALSSWGRWVGAVVSSHPICAPANSGLANQSYTCVSVLRKDYCSFVVGCWIGVWDGIVEQWVEFNPVSACLGGTLCTRVGGQWHLHGTDCGNRAGIVSSPTSC